MVVFQHIHTYRNSYVSPFILQTFFKADVFFSKLLFLNSYSILCRKWTFFITIQNPFLFVQPYQITPFSLVKSLISWCSFLLLNVWWHELFKWFNDILFFLGDVFISNLYHNCIYQWIFFNLDVVFHNHQWHLAFLQM